jgi:hypothetical protein
MTKTYSERRQATYFTAAREFYKLAAAVLDDCINDVELASDATNVWIAGVCRSTMDQGRALETLGHEQCIASTAQERSLTKAKNLHSMALDRYLARREMALKALERRRQETAATQNLVADMERDGLL